MDRVMTLVTRKIPAAQRVAQSAECVNDVISNDGSRNGFGHCRRLDRSSECCWSD